MTAAIFLGSIGVLAETSDIQRRAYNQALDEAGLAWQWDEATYRGLLQSAGGKERLRLLADATATELSDATIESIHARKTELACAEVVASAAPLRPGVAALVRHALEHDVPIGLVTSTYRPNIDAIAEAAGDQLPLDRFAVVVDRSMVARGKPAPDAYRYALDAVGVDPGDAVAVEDSAVSALAAVQSGMRVIATPGAFHRDATIVGATLTLDRLGDDELDPAVAALISG